jgi:hypothetical protein
MRTCEVTDCDNLVEGNTSRCGHHNRLARKISTDRKKEAEKLQGRLTLGPIAKVGKTNTWSCSSGKRVTQEEINRFRDGAYNYQSLNKDVRVCEGCGGQATCRAHIIPQAHCKSLGKTELIWHQGNFFPSCFDCNLAWEVPNGQKWQSLNNVEACLAFMAQHDPVLHSKFIANL